MPKKHRPSSLYAKPQSTAPSSLRSSAQGPADTSNPSEDAASVNNLLQRSRHTSRQADASASSQLQARVSGSIHPSLRAILDIPVVPPPRPREGARHMGGLARTRWIPGPPPPQSWTRPSVDSRTEVVAPSTYRRAQEQACKLPGCRFPPENSLRHVTLKALASSWNWHAKYDHEYLALLPTPMKELLLSYICSCNDNPAVDTLGLLFPPALENEGFIDDSNDLTRLDLENSIRKSRTVADIGTKLIPTRPKGDFRIEFRQDNGEQALRLPEPGAVPDSWEAEVDAIQPQTRDVHSLPELMPRTVLRFPNLRHLSLAINPVFPTSSIALWSELLPLASELSTLTSLSLAYWPVPSYQPHGLNAQTIMSGQISSGGFHSASRWLEATSILRELSRSLYCLKWLDLTGCGHWWEALVCTGVDEEVSFGDDSIEVPDSPLPLLAWNGNWRDIENIHLGIGWTPSGPPKSQEPKSAVEVNEDGVLAAIIDRRYGFPRGRTAELMKRLAVRSEGEAGSQMQEPGVLKQKRERHAMETWDVEEERDKYYWRKELEKYMDMWSCGRKVAERIRRARKAGGGKWIEFEFGEELWS